jgi:hypothetical protein
VIWTNDDSSTLTVTLKDQPATGNNRSKDNSDLRIVEKIRNELVSNIVINVRNVLPDLGVIGERRESTNISSLD